MAGSACALQRYYAWHAHIYDATRWSFLFGRDRVLQLAAQALAGRKRPHIVEVGCGTGRNLKALVRLFPEATIEGVDLCGAMLQRASRAVRGAGDRVRLTCSAYDRHSLPPGSADLIVFSYALSMFNPGYAEALDAAQEHVRCGGFVALADFYATPFAWFRRWMGLNHVRMEAHLPPALTARFRTVHQEIHQAYGGIWAYCCCLGRT